MTQEQIQNVIGPFKDSLPNNFWTNDGTNMNVYHKDGYTCTFYGTLCAESLSIGLSIQNDNSDIIVRCQDEFLLDCIERHGNDFMIEEYNKQLDQNIAKP